MSFDVESDNCRSKGAHQIFDLTIRCVRKYIDATAVLCRLLAAQVYLCKSLQERLSGCLANDQKPKEPNCYLANFCKFSDQHKRASSESELEYWTAMSLYPLASQQSACRNDVATCKRLPKLQCFKGSPSVRAKAEGFQIFFQCFRKSFSKLVLLFSAMSI